MRGVAPYAVGALVLAAVWMHGHGQGRDRERAAQAEALDAVRAEMRALAEETDRAEAARLRAERERDDLREELDRTGDAADGAGDRALPADSLRRIDRIR